MITILDPLGTPTITYNRSGRNIQNIVANAGTAFVDAVQIPHVSEETIVFVDNSLGAGAVYFASDFEVGDTVVIHAGNTYVYDSAGNFNDIVSSPPYGKFIWHDATNNWRRIG